jgi:hypothetical protein
MAYVTMFVWSGLLRGGEVGELGAIKRLVALGSWESCVRCDGGRQGQWELGGRV